MPSFGAFDFGEGTFEAGSVPDLASFGRVGWWFRELNSDDEYEMPINPLDVQMGGVKKRFTTEYTASGRPLTYEGRPEVGTVSLSGTVLTELHFRTLQSWAAKKKQIQVTDDLGRRFMFLIERFEPKRRYHSHFPWRHEYSLSGIILSWL